MRLSLLLPISVLLLPACKHKDSTDDTDTVDTLKVDSDTWTDPDSRDTRPLDTDTGATHTSDTRDTATHTDTAGVILTPEDLQPGDLIITEVMSDPSDCTAPRGQYVEVYYKSGRAPVNLFGLTIKNAGTSSVFVDQDLILPAGTYATLYPLPIGQTPCYPFSANNAPFDATVSFSPVGDHIYLLDGTGRELDHINYNNFAHRTKGSAFELTGDPETHDNQLNTNWCVADTLITGSTKDHGTPGAANTCIPGNDTGDTDSQLDQLLITEVLDFDQPATLRFVELYNPTAQTISLKDYALRVYIDGSASPSITSPLPAGSSIAPGGFFVAAPPGVAAVEFSAAFSYAPNAYFDAISGNGNDAYELVYAGTVIDAYGVPGQDGAGTNWDYTDQTAWRLGGISHPNPTFDRSEWQIDPLPYRNAGERIPSYVPPDTDDTYESPVDTFDTHIRKDTWDTDIYDTDIPPYTIGELAPGDLVITEIMVNPSSCSAPNGQYIVFTTGEAITHAIDLSGLAFENSANIHITMNADYLLYPGMKAVAWYKPTSGAQCFGWDSASLPLAYSAMTFNTGGDIVRLMAGSTVLDEVDFRTFTIPSGASLALDVSHQNATDNNDPANWCAAELSIYGKPDKGVLFGENPICPGAADTGDGGNLPVLLPGDLAPGDLVITEVMAAPGGTCAQANGEYIEILNHTTNARIQLDGLEVSLKDGGGFTQKATPLSGGVIINPGKLAVLYRTPTASQCFGMDSTSTYTALSYGSTLELPDTGTILQIGIGSTILDSVNYGAFSPVVQPAAAWSLDSAHANATDNNSQSNWCATGTLIGGGNTGTPGQLSTCP